MWDLVLLFVVAVANLNVVPVIAADGPVTIWLWTLALIFFFWPQGIAVVELSNRYPQEGGIYLWTKKFFGDFHGFMSGWCYWTNNIFYIPTLLVIVVGISVYVGGANAQHLGSNTLFVSGMAILLLWVMIWLNIRGLSVGKWINNLGGIGTAITSIVLVGLAIGVLRVHGGSLKASDFSIRGADWHLINSFGFICFGLVGLELASVMGDEIEEPRRNVPRAVLWGGLLSGVLYVAATLSLLLAVPKKEIGAVQGILQAVQSMAGKLSVLWLVPVVALVLTFAIAGTTSAWLSGSARIPFVAGLDSYLPSGLGKIHPKFDTPYVALIVQGVMTTLFLLMSFVGSSVEQAYKLLLSLAVVLQLVPFLYMYGAIILIAVRETAPHGHYSRSTLWLAGVSGFVTTAIGMGVAFVPPSDQATWLFELKMGLGCVGLLGVGAFFFLINSRRAPAIARMSRADVQTQGEAR
ncbi:MAG: APC family permease [Candidatus Acidiferrales bacterium]